MNLSAVDLDLLPVLEALLRRRNVTHAANEVGLSQPAVSRALGRLRELFEDPLLIRSGGGLTLTPKAERLAPQVAAALDGLRGLFRDEAFDPAQEQRTVRLVASDVHTLLLLPALTTRLAREAPGIDVQVSAYGPDTVALMQQGRLDLGFALDTTPLPVGTETLPLGYDRLALVMRRGHPLADRPVTAEDYERFAHAAIRIFGDGQSELDAALAARGLSRHIALSTPYFTAALAAVSRSDLLTTISEALAHRLADTFGLVCVPSPLAPDPLRLVLVWDRLRGRDPALIWFRERLREVAAEVYPVARV
ncbi:LysR family transcriptional regulator [Asticcacaulis sp. AND118]|uniref:LysR family transcriptional regulator n=1 Tax=Asticcacaulis sp. AND118 TaxID=2840468 RepID=UPI001CFFA07A|nr:LysR family transcriptional regulator [Asticcacaulis sp. AND118]UDF05465.1 LysR family transcriptional regulator [Asticcacaulis sp. AND118]